MRKRRNIIAEATLVILLAIFTKLEPLNVIETELNIKLPNKDTLINSIRLNAKADKVCKEIILF